MDLMDYILLAKSNRGQGEKWVQLLVFVVIFAGYAIKIFFKAKSELTGDKDDKSERQATSKRSASTRHPISLGNSDYKSLRELRDERRAQIHLRQNAATAKGPQQQYRVPQQPKPRPSQRLVQVQPSVEMQTAARSASVPKPSQKPSPNRRAVKMPIAAGTAPVSRPSKQKRRIKDTYMLEDEIAGKSRVEHGLFNDPDDIRKAIIYQEILGKPLAFR